MRTGSVLLLSMMACAAGDRTAAPPPRVSGTGVELATLEIRDDSVDRFEHCPPPGEIGQEWLPPIPEWHAPAVPASAEALARGSSGGVTDAMADTGSPDAAAPASQQELTDEAINATRVAFRSCYHQGLRADPTQDGHAAFVLRLDRTGRVAAVETWGACDLATEALVCMRDEASHVRMRPPAAGAATVTIPAVFTSGIEHEQPHNAGYAAAAYVAIESMRPRLHACLLAAKRAGESPFASGTMTIDTDSDGHGQHLAIRSWKGSQGLLSCAAEALRDAPFASPPSGKGKVVVPVVFNPRAGTR
jgi:hypothetical protein